MADRKKCMKKMCTFTSHQGNIKTTMRFLLTAMRMAIISEIRKHQMLARMWGESTLMVRMQTGAVITEDNLEIPLKSENRSTI